MKLGIDIDGVLADVLTTWLEHLNRHFEQNKVKEDIIHYQFEKVFGVSWEEMDRFFRNNQENLLTNLSPVEKAQETMEELIKEHNVFLIAARPEEYRSITEKWLTEHSIPYHELIMTDFSDKSDYCLNRGVEVFVEDSLENALAIHACGIPVLLFDAPYNRDPLPKGIFRQHNWREIARTVQELNQGNDKLFKER
ncbi:MAG: hypothetical protein M0Z31_14885 [Clostridia bacterium]|nr:hypothetical protein [Clostridia bacterium]